MTNGAGKTYQPKKEACSGSGDDSEGGQTYEENLARTVVCNDLLLSGCVKIKQPGYSVCITKNELQLLCDVVVTGGEKEDSKV